MSKTLEVVKIPRGRPKKLEREELQDYAKGHSKQMIDVLKGVATRSRSPSARVAAANAILDRAHGKPVLPIGTPLDMKSPFEDMMSRISQVPVLAGK